MTDIEAKKDSSIKPFLSWIILHHIKWAGWRHEDIHLNELWDLVRVQEVPHASIDVEGDGDLLEEYRSRYHQ
jgi:hypothetical protein